MDAIKAMETARAMRHLLPDPVPTALLDRLVFAATRAPSPMNTQCWDFVVVTDHDQRQRLAAGFRDFAVRLDSTLDGLPDEDPSLQRTAMGTRHLVANLAQVPAIIVVTGTLVYPPNRPRERYTYSAMYAAAQNLLVAARSLGLGATFTTLHEVAEPRFRETLGIPDDRLIGVTVPIGWPARPFGPVKRKPLDAVIHRDRWKT